MSESSNIHLSAAVALSFTVGLPGLIPMPGLQAGEGEPPLNASATIEAELTPAGHVGAKVEVTFSGPLFYSVASWREPRIEGEKIYLEAEAGSPFTVGGEPPFPPIHETHHYKLFDVHRSPAPRGEALAFRTVTFPAGTSPIPEGEVVLRSREEWNEWIAPFDLTLGPLPVAPPVDFEREIFVGVFLGQTSGCHAVEIRRITALDEGSLLVEYTAALPAPDKPVTEGLINPRHVVALARTDAPVEFSREVSIVPAAGRAVSVKRPEYPFFAPDAPMTSVIRSEEAWARFLDRVAGERDPAFPAPPVDLTSEMLIGVFLGRTPLGRGISVSEVSENGQEMLVQIVETIGGVAPPPDEYAYPLDFIAVPRSDLPVRFRRTIYAFPSPPPGGGPGEAGEPGEPGEADGDETRHGFFEVIFQLDGCELARSGFFYPEVPRAGGVVLDALSESASALALDATFHLGLTSDTTVNWEAPVQKGQNLTANVTVMPKPETAGIGISFPGPASFSHRYVIPDLTPGLYRFELRVNDAPAGHVFFRHPSWENPTSAFEARLQAVLIRPVWEPVPEAGLLGDLDGDQVGDFFEDALGSDPFDAASRPAWEIHTYQPPGEARGTELVLIRRRTTRIDLEHSADLNEWQDANPPPETVIEPLIGEPDLERLTMRWSPLSDARMRFFRFQVSEDRVEN